MFLSNADLSLVQIKIKLFMSTIISYGLFLIMPIASLFTSVVTPITGLLPHTYMLDSTVLCCEGHPGTHPVFPPLPGISLESIHCIICFHHVMDVFVYNFVVLLHALQLGLQPASYPL
jgi:hypothetical protein